MRPILLGKDNPHSDDPGHALMPHPPGCAGHRLWKLTGLSRPDYLRAFERRNFCDDPYIFERRVFVLGKAVWRAVPLPMVEWLETVRAYRSIWTLVPHPSGRCHLYNDPAMRKRVQELLLGAISCWRIYS